MSKRFLAQITLSALVLQLFSPLAVRAQLVEIDAGFNPDYILSDEDIFDVNGMSYDRMVRFLRTKGTLADYRTVDIDGVPKTAAEIIWRVANSYQINPKYLLVLLQKEQSLVEDPNPSQRQFDWAMGYAVCDSCSKDDPALKDFKGFASQVEWAAKQHREKYLLQILATGTTKAGKAPGKAMIIDGQTVTPQNKATAMLYAYTPHIHGNLNLWRIWRRWFSLNYPDGTVAKSKSSGKTYLIRLGQKRPFASRAVLESLVDPNKVVTVADTELSAYPDGPEVRFPKYALLKDETGKMWLLAGESRREIADMKAFRKFGFNEDELLDVTAEEIKEYPIGLPITTKTEFPQGVVLQDKTSKKLWYVENDTKREIPNAAFLNLYFDGRKAKVVSTKTLDAYKIGEPYRFHDAELVRGQKDAAVYVVEDGLLRPIVSGQVFETMGWKWKNVVTVPDKILADYPKGEVFDLQSAPVAPPATLSAL